MAGSVGRAVWESIRYSAVCQDCGAELECFGVQALMGDALRWDVEAVCSACGFELAVCNGVLPSGLRDQLLTEHGPARLRVTSSEGRGVAIMRVLRNELGCDLADARTALSRVLAGEFSGTLPEMELLARKLQQAGITAESFRL